MEARACSVVRSLYARPKHPSTSCSQSRRHKSPPHAACHGQRRLCGAADRCSADRCAAVVPTDRAVRSLRAQPRRNLKRRSVVRVVERALRIGVRRTRMAHMPHYVKPQRDDVHIVFHPRRGTPLPSTVGRAATGLPHSGRRRLCAARPRGHVRERRGDLVGHRRTRLRVQPTAPQAISAPMRRTRSAARTCANHARTLSVTARVTAALRFASIACARSGSGLLSTAARIRCCEWRVRGEMCMTDSAEPCSGIGAWSSVVEIGASHSCCRYSKLSTQSTSTCHAKRSLARRRDPPGRKAMRRAVAPVEDGAASPQRSAVAGRGD